MNSRGRNMKKILLLLAFLNIGCAKELLPVNQNEELRDYAQFFVDAGKEVSGANYEGELNQISLAFKDMKTDSFEFVIGYCEIIKENTGGIMPETYTKGRVIRINRAWWNQATEADKIILMSHELGHCILKRRHKDSFVKTRMGAYLRSIKESIMHPYHVNTIDFINNNDYYWNELFLKNGVFDTEYASNIIKDDQNYASKTSRELASVHKEDHEHGSDCVKVGFYNQETGEVDYER